MSHREKNASGLRKDALKMTLRCLGGCNAGEGVGAAIGGFILGWGFSSAPTLAIGISLAFGIGYLTTILPMLRKMGIKKATRSAIVGDTASISSMEAVENALAFAIPGFIAAGFFSPTFWIGLAIILPAGFAAAYPAMYWGMKRERKKEQEEGEHMRH